MADNISCNVTVLGATHMCWIQYYAQFTEKKTFHQNKYTFVFCSLQKYKIIIEY